MNTRTVNPKSAAVISFLLCLPFTILYTLLALNIEPDFGPLEPLLSSPDPDRPDIVGSLIALGLMLLLPASLFINLRVIIQARRAGKDITAHPVNLALAVFAFILIVMIIGGIIVDQYPCWAGVPDCD